MTLEESLKIIEGLLFAAPYPLSTEEIAKVIDMNPKIVGRLVQKLKEEYRDRGIMLRTVAGGYQFVTTPEIEPWVEKIGRPVIAAPLSVAALETLAIIAYQQPITRTEIEEIRGVRADSAVNTLQERELIIELGRKDGPGRPIMYGTSDNFLVHFGLDSLDDLPERPDFSQFVVENE